jgi:hypothetical protein
MPQEQHFESISPAFTHLKVCKIAYFPACAHLLALTTPLKRHKEKVFRGDLAGRLAATLKNSLK